MAFLSVNWFVGQGLWIIIIFLRSWSFSFIHFSFSSKRTYILKLLHSYQNSNIDKYCRLDVNEISSLGVLYLPVIVPPRNYSAKACWSFDFCFGQFWSHSISLSFNFWMVSVSMDVEFIFDNSAYVIFTKILPMPNLITLKQCEKSKKKTAL